MGLVASGVNLAIRRWELSVPSPPLGKGEELQGESITTASGFINHDYVMGPP